MGVGEKRRHVELVRSPDPSNWGDGDPCPQFLHFKVIFGPCTKAVRDPDSTLISHPRLFWLLAHSPSYSMDYSSTTSSRNIS